MRFKNSQQDVVIEEDANVKCVSLKISGGADSAIVAYMLCEYVTKERPDIKIIPITTIHPAKPYQEIYAKRVIEHLQQKFGNIFGKHYVNIADSADDYIKAQERLWKQASEIEQIDTNYSGITANPPKEITEQHSHDGPVDNRNGKNFPVIVGKFRRHLSNIDKKGVAELYKTLGVIDTLFPITRSCEAHEESEEYDINKHCGECWWCMERHWGFNRYT